jgi:hypothetical protein
MEPKTVMVCGLDKMMKHMKVFFEIFKVIFRMAKKTDQADIHSRIKLCMRVNLKMDFCMVKEKLLMDHKLNREFGYKIKI